MEKKSVWILAPADITTGVLKGIKGTVVGYDSVEEEVQLELDEITLLLIHPDHIDQSPYLSKEFG